MLRQKHMLVNNSCLIKVSVKKMIPQKIIEFTLSDIVANMYGTSLFWWLPPLCGNIVFTNTYIFCNLFIEINVQLKELICNSNDSYMKKTIQTL